MSKTEAFPFSPAFQDQMLGDNWSYVNQYNKTLMKMNEDIERISPGVLLDKFAGKLARSTQARRGK